MSSTRLFSRVTHLSRRFDPRFVAAGVAVLVVGLVFGFVGFGQSSRQADEVAAPVASLCREGGVAATQLADTGACQAAQNVSTGLGPYRSNVEGPAGEPGQAGAAGERGLAGVAGQSGPPGVSGSTGPSGATGQPGVVGNTGAVGAPGADGEPGATGQAGQSIVGPAGPAGPAGETIVGPQGPQGPQGVQGAAGAPASQQTFATEDGRIFQCVRDGGTDSAPMYRCAEQPTETTPETPGG